MNFKCDFLKTMIFLTQISDTCFSVSIEATGLIKINNDGILLQPILQKYAKNIFRHRSPFHRSPYICHTRLVKLGNL